MLHLPLVPLSGTRELVRCGFCRRAFHPSILERVQLTDRPGATTGGDGGAPDPELEGAAASTLLTWSEGPEGIEDEADD